MPARKPDEHGAQALPSVLADLDAGALPDPVALGSVVRHLLGALAEQAPGRSVEVRVPPVAAIQCVEGPRHTRGTPPNVIETDPVTFVRLATGRQSWSQALEVGAVRASGARADISAWLPLA